MANLNLSEFTEKLFVADADHTFIWDTANAISKRVSRNSWLSGTTADFHLGLADAASPVAQTISVQSVVAGTSNTAGASFSINGSQGTGTGAGGSLLLRTAPAGSSGTAQNALVTAVAITSAGNVGIGTTSPSSKLHVAETWNAGGTTFAAAKVVVTDTASAAASTLLELWSDAVTPTLKYSFGKSGAFKIFGGNSSTINCNQLVTNNGIAGNTDWGVYLTNSSGIILKDTLSLGWSSGVATLGADTILRRDGEADHLAMRRGALGQKFSVYGTYPGAAWERFTITAPTSGNVLLGTYKGTGGIARGLEFQTDGVTRMTINAAGTSVIFPSGIALQRTDGGGAIFDFTYNGVQFSNTDGLGVSWSTITGPASSKHVGIYGYASEPGVVQINSSVKGTLRDLRCRSVVQQLPITTTQTPTLNGDFVVEATSNTVLTFKLKGTDGTVRSGTITLA